jgi:hypothetical protein
VTSKEGLFSIELDGWLVNRLVSVSILKENEEVNFINSLAHSSCTLLSGQVLCYLIGMFEAYAPTNNQDVTKCGQHAQHPYTDAQHQI